MQVKRRALLNMLAMAPWLSAVHAAEPVATAVEIEAGVYMVPGASGEIGPANLGRVGNAGFIVGRAGVIAIDTGTSFRHGEVLLQAIAQVTDKPVRLALVTQARQEFLFGASAYQARGIPVHMHRRAAQLMAGRCDGCLKALQRELGEVAMRGTVVFRPDQVFDESHAMDMIGRPVLVQFYGHSSGPGDIAVFDLRTGTLFGGGMLDHRRIPDVQDSDLDGWKHALAGLRTLRLSTIVPGHGPATTPDVVDTVERYLVRLESRVAALLRQGAPLSVVPDAADLPEYRHWDQYDTIHRRNASIVFLRMERAQMLGEPTTGAPR
jgi:glyoxylase-like metal-dependent hydrolase (beta-lactamase superfamily II)